MRKIKTIQFKIALEGSGIVNYDSMEQKWIHNNNNTGLPPYYKDNINFAKKNFYGTDVIREENGKGNLDYKIKISSDCLKKNLFSDYIIATSPNMQHNDYVLYNYIASPIAILKGWMFANDDETTKRGGGLNITDAEQVCNAKSIIETFSRQEYKESKQNIDDDSSNTFYKKETIGKIRYAAHGAVDICKLQLITADKLLDRYSFNPDNFELYKKFFKNYFGDDNIKLAYNKLITSVIDLDEYSVILSDNHIKKLIRILFSEFLKFQIRKRDAYVQKKSLQIRLVSDPTICTSDNPEGWYLIETIEDLDKILETVEIHKFYEEVDTEAAIENRKKFEDKKSEIILKSRKKKEDKKEAKSKKVKEDVE